LNAEPFYDISSGFWENFKSGPRDLKLEETGRIVDAVRQEVGGGYPVLLKSGYLEDFGPLVEETCQGAMWYVVINSIAKEVRGSAGELTFAERGGGQE
jgi:hypothetical protein